MREDHSVDSDVWGSFPFSDVHLKAWISKGRRPFLGSNLPPWEDHILFHEYFHAETGGGLGTSLQTALIAKLANTAFNLEGGGVDSSTFVLLIVASRKKEYILD